MTLPVREIEKEIVETLRRCNRLVLTAPTGSGKTTQVPQIVLQSGLLSSDQQIIVLQPRRLATRMVAQRVAQELGCPLGGLVGYQTRHESAMSGDTRIRFMTEGLMLRVLQAEPSLPGVGAVILDEFHERNVHADVSLGWLKLLQERSGGRSALKLMVMSATLDTTAIASYLRCEVLRAGGRLHPVETTYLSKGQRDPVWELAADVLAGVLVREPHGHVLVFMPGVYEINRTIEACRRRVGSVHPDVQFHPLHGSLSAAEQDAAVSPAERRKVIVATNVAETSITIDGVRAVIDSGLARIHRHDAARGVNVLRVEPISKASADQRAGRAGRTGPGICMRLWTLRDHTSRPDHEAPELLRLELSETLLQLKSMGIAAPRDFPWLQPPSEQAVTQGEALLQAIHATDAHGAITSLGRTMSRFPIHPRLSRFIVDACARGSGERAVIWAAIIGEREIFNRPARSVLMRFLEDDGPVSDLAAREGMLRELAQVRFSQRRCEELGVSSIACREIHRSALQLEKICHRAGLTMNGPGRTEDLIKSLMTAFSDHLAIKLDANRPNCAMPGRRKVVLERDSVVETPGPILAMEVREIGRGDDQQTVLSLVSQVNTEWIDEVLPGLLKTRREAMWNAQNQAVEDVEALTLSDMELSRTVRPAQPSHEVAAELVRRIVSGEAALEKWDDRVEQWILRTRCVGLWFPERQLITYDEDDRRVILHEIVAGATRLSQVRDRPCLQAVRDALSWDDQQFVERMAPESIELPRGWRMKIEYRAEAPPRGRAKIQDLYGVEDTPRIAQGRQALLLEILAPNHRPIQVTGDLKNFWDSLYPEVKKELKRRYPKHEWR